MKVDTLIIGSGVVATALTKRLLEHTPQKSILILEAGHRRQDQGLRHMGGLPGHRRTSPYNRDLRSPVSRAQRAG